MPNRDIYWRCKNNQRENYWNNRTVPLLVFWLENNALQSSLLKHVALTHNTGRKTEWGSFNYNKTWASFSKCWLGKHFGTSSVISWRCGNITIICHNKVCSFHCYEVVFLTEHFSIRKTLHCLSWLIMRYFPLHCQGLWGYWFSWGMKDGKMWRTTLHGHSQRDRWGPI